MTGSESLHGGHPHVRGIFPSVVSPPIDVDAIVRPLQGKEDDDETDDDARIESRRKNIVVSHPPSEVVAPHEPLEDATSNDPPRKVNTINGWGVVSCGQRHGDIDVAPERARAATGEEVEGDGRECSDQEEPDERVIAEEIRQLAIDIDI